jgi:hypothetical protein
MNIGSKTLEYAKRKFHALYCNRIFTSHNKCSYNYVLNNLNYTRRCFKIFFEGNIYNAFVTCPFLLEAVGVRFTVRNIRGLIHFTIRFHVRNVLVFVV